MENTLYIWKYFVLNIRADSSRHSNCFALLRLWFIDCCKTVAKSDLCKIERYL